MVFTVDVVLHRALLGVAVAGVAVALWAFAARSPKAPVDTEEMVLRGDARYASLGLGMFAVFAAAVGTFWFDSARSSVADLAVFALNVGMTLLGVVAVVFSARTRVVFSPAGIRVSQPLQSASTTWANYVGIKPLAHGTAELVVMDERSVHRDTPPLVRRMQLARGLSGITLPAEYLQGGYDRLIEVADAACERWGQ